jgi:hypothetical protein
MTNLWHRSSRFQQIRSDLIKSVGQAGQGDREITECISDRWAMFGVQLSPVARAVASDDSVYVADISNHRIQKFTSGI